MPLVRPDTLLLRCTKFRFAPRLAIPPNYIAVVLGPSGERRDPNTILIKSSPLPSRTLMRFASTLDTGETGLASAPEPNGPTMLDIAFIALGLAFFGLAAGYAVLCERF
ncbi:hypothetical protein MPOCJGCO_3181 [Methylobacterium trifolii]|uniref:Uncharacterized protein n=2 Tax=Methylobacterium trifolii TaxID=1003092 RepID=A0ABQ4U0Q7_9HYPH|nr:hypothetical protein MPOCJGCO_3181 [Methylobacterium trifolii]